MSNIAELEKLAELKDKGIISAKEFEEQKKALLESNVVQAEMLTRKSQLIYVLLAFFLGCFGIHNFYAGYKGRGIAQLVLTLISPFTLFLSLLVVYVWVVVNIFAINKDAEGKDFIPAKGVAMALGIISIVSIIFVILVFGIAVAVGVSQGYNEAKQSQEIESVIQELQRIQNQNRSY